MCVLKCSTSRDNVTYQNVSSSRRPTPSVLNNNPMAGAGLAARDQEAACGVAESAP